MFNKRTKKDVVAAFGNYINQEELQVILDDDAKSASSRQTTEIEYLFVDTGSETIEAIVNDIRILLEITKESRLIACYIANSFVFLYSSDTTNEEIRKTAQKALKALPELRLLTGSCKAVVTNYGGATLQTYGPVVENYRALMSALLSLKPGELSAM